MAHCPFNTNYFQLCRIAQQQGDFGLHKERHRKSPTILDELSATRKLSRNGFWEARQIGNDKSACGK